MPRTPPRPRAQAARSVGTAELRPLPVLLLLAALVLTAAVTLRPVGDADGWAWGAPAEEVRWYLGGLGSPATLRQLLGNLLLLAPVTAAAVVCVPRLGGARLLVTAAVLAGVTIEALQWLLPLGRVVSPTDLVLNASGAVVAGLLTARVRRRRPRSRGAARGSVSGGPSSGTDRVSGRGRGRTPA